MTNKILTDAAHNYAVNCWDAVDYELDFENMTPIEISELDFMAGAQFVADNYCTELIGIVLEHNITTLNFEVDSKGLIDLDKTLTSISAEISSKDKLKEIDIAFNKREFLHAQSLLNSLEPNLGLDYTPIFIKNYNRRISFTLA